MFHAQDGWDRLFEIGILGKGLIGLVEVLGGLVLLLASPDGLRRLTRSWTRGELAEDPYDLIATRLLHSVDHLTGPAVLFGAVYLLVHGAVKVVLVVALLLNRLWAYPAMITVLLLFIGYQSYEIVRHPTAGLVALTLFDTAVLALTWREYRRQRPPAGRLR